MFVFADSIAAPHCSTGADIRVFGGRNARRLDPAVIACLATQLLEIDGLVAPSWTWLAPEIGSNSKRYLQTITLRRNQNGILMPTSSRTHPCSWDPGWGRVREWGLGSLLDRSYRGLWRGRCQDRRCLPDSGMQHSRGDGYRDIIL